MNDIDHNFEGNGVCPCQPTLIHLTEDGRPVWWHINSDWAIPPVELVAEMIARARWLDLADIREEV